MIRVRSKIARNEDPSGYKDFKVNKDNLLKWFTFLRKYNHLYQHFNEGDFAWPEDVPTRGSAYELLPEVGGDDGGGGEGGDDDEGEGGACDAGDDEVGGDDDEGEGGACDAGDDEGAAHLDNRR